MKDGAKVARAGACERAGQAAPQGPGDARRVTPPLARSLLVLLPPLHLGH